MKKVVFIAFTCGITYSINAQTTLKRYKSLSDSTTDNGLVTISVSSTNISSTSDPLKFKTIYDLTEKGQSSVLTNKTNEQTTDLLNKKFLIDKESKKSIVDLTSKNLRVTFSIDRKVNYSNKKKFSAYDRIENLNYSFEMNNNINNEVKFTKWNKYSTEYGTLDVGTLEYTQSFSANLGLTGKSTATTSTKNTEKSGDNTSESSASFGPELSATANTSYSNSKKENQLIKQHYIQLTGSFEERKFCIHQQGTRETELAGNVSIDLTIKLPTKELLITSFSQLFNESGLPNPSDKINLNVIRYYVPDEDLLPNGVNGIIKYDFVVRHIQKGANTFPEFDDKINFILGENSSNITLIKKEDLIVPTYFIKLSMKNNLPSLTYLESGKNIVIQFINYEDAFEFKNWLINKIHSLDNDLTITGRIISFNGLKLSDNSVKENLTKIEIDIYKPQ